MSFTPFLLILSQLMGDLYFKFGSDTHLNFYENKYLSAGYFSELNSLIDQQLEFGFIHPSNPQEHSSFYGAYQIGLKTHSELYAEVLTGIAFISSPDSRLSSAFQFKHDIGLGIKDKRNVSIGADYTHISNAGIKLPNLGRDYVQLKLSFPFN